MNLTVLLKRRKLEAQWPFRRHDDDAGHDLVCCETAIVWPFTTKDIDTGWDIKIPDGTWGTVKTRTSTFSKRRLMILEGVIDPGYTGQLSTVVFNPTFFPKIIRKGDRLAQLIVTPIVQIGFKTVKEMPRTHRGPQGFGSTGRGFERRESHAQ